MVGVAACREGPTGPESQSKMFEGLITDLVARSLLEIDSIEVTDESGTSRRFHAAGRRFAEFTPSHMREHMFLGQKVVVTYRESEGILVIEALEDAADARPGPS